MSRRGWTSNELVQPRRRAFGKAKNTRGVMFAVNHFSRVLVSILLVFTGGLTQAATESAAPPADQQLPVPQWPKGPQAPAGAPNVLVIMTDDVGFGASSTFGGPVPTPTFDALAREGLRFNQFHTTAICSPTRAALLTGRNPHNVAMGNATNVATGYQGYTSVMPKSAGTIARVLTDAGYGTAMFGKGHITPMWEAGPAGPFDRWPTGLGFQHFFGFLDADASMFEPSLVEGTRQLESAPNEPDYYFDKDLADRAIVWIRQQKSLSPDRPLFIYYATGSAHAPNHAPREWLEKFRGKFEQGWDAVHDETFARQRAAGVLPPGTQLTPRPAVLPAWSTLSADQRRLSARLMEAYAAALAHADFQIGRVVAALRATGAPGDTMIVYIQGDNGSAADGGVSGLLFEQSQINGVAEDPTEQLRRIDEIGTVSVYNTLPAAWGWAMNTPFQWYKRVASHFGGIRNGMVIWWPGHVTEPGRVRSQFHHVSDVMPTILDAARVKAPASIDGVAQKPLDGISMTYTFREPDAAPHRRSQIFEMMESMGLYDDGWMLSSTPIVIPWSPGQTPKVKPSDRQWELYDIRSDFSQARNLAAANPAKLREMQQKFWRQAESGTILPIHGLYEGREGMPDPALGRSEFTFFPGQQGVTEYAGAPPISGRSFEITADVTIKEGGAHGVLAAHGGRFGGYSFFVDGGVLKFYYGLGTKHYSINGKSLIAPGEHSVTAKFDIDTPRTMAGGTLTLLVDGAPVGQGRIDSTLRRISHTEGFDVGRDTVSPVSSDYTVADSGFSGDLHRIRVVIR